MSRARATLAIRLEGRLERVESLVRQWEAAATELRAGALPSPDTLGRLAQAERETAEACAKVEAFDELRAVTRALRRARLRWATKVRRQLETLGVPVAALGPVGLVSELQALGNVEVLSESAVDARREAYKSIWAFLAVVWGCAWLALEFLVREAPVLVLGLVALAVVTGYVAIRGLGHLRSRGRTALDQHRLLVGGLDPIDLRQVDRVCWPGSTLNPTSLEFHLVDGTVVTRTFRPNADQLLARLRARGVRVTP